MSLHHRQIILIWSCIGVRSCTMMRTSRDQSSPTTLFSPMGEPCLSKSSRCVNVRSFLVKIATPKRLSNLRTAAPPPSLNNSPSFVSDLRSSILEGGLESIASFTSSHSSHAPSTGTSHDLSIDSASSSNVLAVAFSRRSMILASPSLATKPLPAAIKTSLNLPPASRVATPARASLYKSTYIRIFALRAVLSSSWALRQMASPLCSSSLSFPNSQR
mmetsp:Transcript_40370/g.92829  ORF Transcript_40370/g.92829 Transcript_40370/m.92829 type:complete len:217 (-) Transcript_40370:1051-1701(-)